jgi:TFIIF-interacting CTD phosphatase-like protein
MFNTNLLKKITKNILIFVGANIIGIYCYIEYKKNSSSKLNIVLDLDETIIHTDKSHNLDNFNKSNILEPNIIGLTILSSSNINSSSNRIVWIRPGVKLLLPLVAQFNNIYLFTKATKPYTDEILLQTNLDKYFKDKKYRDECVGTCKDLKKFNLNINKTILIDDKLSNRCSGQNFYHIPRFNYWVKNDWEFFKLFGYIIWLNIKNDLKLN